MINLKNLTNKISKRISDYIEFDVIELFEQSDFISIYGGAVRDSIADLDIHDVDILCMPKSAQKLKEFITKKYDYKQIDLYDIDSLNMYRDITVISEPWTFINKNKKIIQIIRPRFFSGHKPNYNSISDYKNAYINLIKNVDISCCGVFIENKNNKILLKESCKNAIIHCLTKTFEINDWSTQYNKNRTNIRKYKLEDKGWMNISKLGFMFIDDNEEKKYLQKEREMKLISLNFKPEYDYIIWKESDYVVNKMINDIDDDIIFS